MKQIPPALQTLRDQLHRLHRTYLEALKYQHERAQGHPVNATQWFMTLTQNPDYAWFRPFTQLITEFDILIDEDVVTPEDIKTIAIKTKSLFTPGATDNPFSLQFFEAMPKDPDMMMAFPALREAIKALA